MIESSIGIPHLATANEIPESNLIAHILQQQIQIEAWFREKWQQVPPLITCSVDLRNAGFKLAPVDTNVFPAGFNNINPAFHPLCIQAIQATLNEYHPGCNKCLLIPESHTRNPFYLESVDTLCHFLNTAGYETKIGSLLTLNQATELNIPSSGASLTLNPLKRTDDRLSIEGFDPCLIILNNDLSDGVPDILKNIQQAIIPSPSFSWANRSKTKHFEYYQQIALEFSKLIDIDSWAIMPLFLNCGEVDFMEGKGLSCVMSKTEELLAAIQSKYDQHNIKQKPFVVIKADAGTYGMAVMMVQSADELKNLNRKQRLNMAKGKGGIKVQKVIIQEGVYTLETVGKQESVAEPVVYMIGHHVIGGFYRVHQKKGNDENLNSPGMHFEPLAFAECCNTPDERLSLHDSKNRFYAYSVIARLAHLATAMELNAII